MSHFFRYTLMPLFLLVCCPPFAMLIWHINADLHGSLTALVQEFSENGFFYVLYAAWAPHFFGSATAWKIIGVFAALQLILMRILPGAKYNGTITPMGNLPEYKNNGLLSYLLSFAFFLGASVGLGWFSPAIIYMNYGDILGALNITALVFCLVLYFKGKFAPSSSDHGSSGNFIFDYYWGTELYPRILGWDVKMFTNCRFGMTGWALSVTSFAFAQKELYGAADPSIIVSALLLDLYLLKFFIWEPGYMRSMDIIVDRAGFYICWGCLVWVPSLYTSPVMFMVHHPVGLSWIVAGIILVLGGASIFINYWSDRQRQVVRATNGNTNIWGKPARIIHAKYKTEKGEEKETVLLASGFWGISSHFHYLPEWASAFFWSCATGFNFLMPFFYLIFLIILLLHRAYRDEEKCRAKYGEYWTEYRKRVPYNIIPGVY